MGDSRSERLTYPSEKVIESLREVTPGHRLEKWFIESRLVE